METTIRSAQINDRMRVQVTYAGSAHVAQSVHWKLFYRTRMEYEIDLAQGQIFSLEQAQQVARVLLTDDRHQLWRYVLGQLLVDCFRDGVEGLLSVADLEGASDV